MKTIIAGLLFFGLLAVSIISSRPEPTTYGPLVITPGPHRPDPVPGWQGTGPSVALETPPGSGHFEIHLGQNLARFGNPAEIPVRLPGPVREDLADQIVAEFARKFRVKVTSVTFVVEDPPAAATKLPLGRRVEPAWLGLRVFYEPR